MGVSHAWTIVAIAYSINFCPKKDSPVHLPASQSAILQTYSIHVVAAVFQKACRQSHPRDRSLQPHFLEEQQQCHVVWLELFTHPMRLACWLVNGPSATGPHYASIIIFYSSLLHCQHRPWGTVRWNKGHKDSPLKAQSWTVRMPMAFLDVADITLKLHFLPRHEGHRFAWKRAWHRNIMLLTRQICNTFLGTWEIKWLFFSEHCIQDHPVNLSANSPFRLPCSTRIL